MSKAHEVPFLFQAFKALKVPESDSFYKKVESGYDEFEEGRFSRPDRKKEVGEGRLFNLGLNGRHLMPLVYYRLYITLALKQSLCARGSAASMLLRVLSGP